ncbi:hypothetical protein [Mycobacteroides abscessus]|uniref:hypothetical protein n=1 Tax=Mycobacteroides abscessus TaxID=36809 RepID=UPI0009263CD5|nr:hypothetical protein [Mycobacteroides abscessus]SIN11638.1 Uncharacterised protein [Mycobacteroides abscessus subsp. abscessus]
MKLEPTEAQRKAMAEATEAWNWYSCGPERRLDMVDDMIAAANIPEGPPVGTIARRPDGEWIAWRTEDGWGYRFIGDEEPNEWPPGSSIADSWPVIFTPGEAVGSGPTTDGGETYDPREGEALRQAGPCQSIDPVSELKCSQTLGHEGNHGTCSGLEWPDPTAQQEPVIRGTVQDALRPDDVALLETDPMEFVRRTQQEPGESLARGLDDLAAGRVSRRDDYLEPEDPEYCGNCDGRKCMGCVFREYDHDCADDCPDCCTTARTPRVVDRLGVDEQGSRWRDANGFEWRWGAGNWFYYREQEWAVAFPDVAGPFREILEPRVLPSLDCEEARDGTVWEFTDGSDGTRRIQHQDGEWICRTKGHSHTCAGTMDWATGSASLGFGPYTEVIGDPS